MPQRIEAWHRRSALHLAAQLPDTAVDALKVLACTREIVDKFFLGAGGEPATKMAVTRNAASRRGLTLCKARADDLPR